MSWQSGHCLGARRHPTSNMGACLQVTEARVQRILDRTHLRRGDPYPDVPRWFAIMVREVAKAMIVHRNLTNTPSRLSSTASWPLSQREGIPVEKFLCNRRGGSSHANKQTGGPTASFRDAGLPQKKVPTKRASTYIWSNPSQYTPQVSRFLWAAAGHEYQRSCIW